jgi:hypothetical protein
MLVRARCETTAYFCRESTGYRRLPVCQTTPFVPSEPDDLRAGMVW